MRTDFAKLIGGWPRDVERKLTSIGTFAADIGVDHQHALTMRVRKIVAPLHWPKLLKAAKRRGIALAEDDLVKMYSYGREEMAKKRRSEVAARSKKRGAAALAPA